MVYDTGWKSLYSIQLSEKDVISNILSHCEIWSHFTHSLYFGLPSPHENMDSAREITLHISH